jgi:hypothetical protein
MFYHCATASRLLEQKCSISKSKYFQSFFSEMSKYFIVLVADNMDVLKDNVTRKTLNHVKIKNFKSQMLLSALLFS